MIVLLWRKAIALAWRKAIAMVKCDDSPARRPFQLNFLARMAIFTAKIK
jgi:hypothetical protein